MLAKALAVPGSAITEKGFIRNLSDNSIGYKALTISEIKPSGIQFTELQLPHKTCFVKSETAMKNQSLDSALKNKVEKLIESEPDKIPEDEMLFRIWQMEYIEKGLREY
jgi:hypothetical protein